MNSARRDLDLVGPTNPDYLYAPCVPDSQDFWDMTNVRRTFLPIIFRR
jgi:hypothetical protein